MGTPSAQLTLAIPPRKASPPAKISLSKQLTVLRSPTRYGSVTISILAPYSPSEDTLTSRRESLTLAIDEALIS
ncbi:hypothetical protein FEM03_15615 [Phragmitibacter flavus]|uniref:Uncharacterized protein n=1 Tax=Phragmitibacter flavus TaxID=2576071 RepID=A0A5R8KBQ7_9BACT|nr:hypothetical protein [Phragmitibacter flavus]TLD69753.1 hypothetical protein FEM03_15615 [Phragmitibacter flavus]